jgi:hypothetical protein
MSIGSSAPSIHSCSPGTTEGQPRPAIEVTASDLPIVAAEIRSCDDVSLGAAIERLVGAREQDAVMGAASAAKVRREFESAMSWARVTYASHTAAARRDIDLDPEPA